MESIVWNFRYEDPRSVCGGRRVSPHDLLGVELENSLRAILRPFTYGDRFPIDYCAMVVTPALGINCHSCGVYPHFLQSFWEISLAHKVYVFENEIELARWLAEPVSLQRAKQHYKMKKGAVHPVKTTEHLSQS